MQPDNAGLSAVIRSWAASSPPLSCGGLGRWERSVAPAGGGSSPHPRRSARFRATLCAESADAAMRHSSNPFRTLQQITQLPRPGRRRPCPGDLSLSILITGAGFHRLGVPMDRATAVVIVGLGAVAGVRQRTTAIAISQRHQVT